ncbi:MAG: SPFH domain-containing protein [Candidatus Paraimprobicoccus trichonymphae]|uniref:SPFH domain-containing protein n=1 Tax=Candidatus Paraimprobicoccus trichonymphae TaxID=3033793 RepID=A0AA48I423_9FIRM|nr:MAG: SPFH domain-containing protein [Candidatus Paraimprobicoccus trichonymphae]
MAIGIILFVVLVIFALIIWFSTFYTVQHQSIAIIERFGKFHRTAEAGLHSRTPFGVDRIVQRIPLRIQQHSIEIETKTKDNVFVHLNFAVQFQVNIQKVVDAYYKLSAPIVQIKSYVEDAIRSSLPKYTLDESYEKKDDITHDVFDTVFNEMLEYGYIIIKTLITAIEPAREVKESMNAINAAQRHRYAVQELADAEKDRLHGEGIANQRKAIVDGLSESFNELKSSGLSEKDIMSILLTEQYLALHTFAKHGNQVGVLASWR